MNKHPLLEYLKNHSISQKDFADKAGVSKEWVSDIVRFKKFPSFKYAQKLSDATDGHVQPHEFYQAQKSA